MIKYVIGILLLAASNGYGQAFKNIGFSPGINFTNLEWEYRLANGDDPETRKSKERGIGINLYITTDVIEKKNWAINSSLGWIQKKGLYTEPRTWSVTRIPYRLNYISWINSARAELQAGDRLTLHASTGPRVEYLLTAWDDFPWYARNDDAFYYYHKKSDVRKVNIGITSTLGLTWRIDNISLQLTGWTNTNFTPVMSAQGLREDGLGDDGFYLKMRDNTFGINLHFIFLLKSAS